MDIAKQDAMLARKLASLSKLQDEINARTKKLVEAKARQASAQANKKLPAAVVAGTVAAKVTTGHVEYADEVRLRGYIYPPGPDGGDPSGVCYEYVRMTGDPEQDKWRGGAHDHTGPTFIKTGAIKKWNKLAKQLNDLIAKSEVVVNTKCRCR